MGESKRDIQEKNSLLDYQTAGLACIEAQIGDLNLQPQARADRYKVRPFQLTGAPIPSCFVDRPSKVRKMEEDLLSVSAEYSQKVVLQGFGGVGKSQLARKYAV